MTSRFQKIKAEREAKRNADPAHHAELRRVVLGTEKVRNAVLPEYEGFTNEHVIEGSCDSARALEVFRAHYAKTGLAVEVSGVSPAEIHGPKGKEFVWLPEVNGYGQLMKQYRFKATRLEEELALVKEQLARAKVENEIMHKVYKAYRQSLTFYSEHEVERLDRILWDSK